MKTATVIVGFLALGSGCLYTGDGTAGLPCNTDTECGGTQLCIEHICGGPVAADTGVTASGSSDDSSSGGAPITTNDDDDIRTMCEASETECIDDQTLRLCTEDGKLSTRECNGWCGQAAAHNGCQTQPDGVDTCFCLNPAQPCTEEGDYQCDGDNFTRCVDGFARPIDCDTVCKNDGYSSGVDSCGLNDQGDVTCFCRSSSDGCEDGASRCVDEYTSQECWGGQWQNYDCLELECPAGTYSRGCTYFPGETEGCGCWEL